jgi:tetratricopeptide (TPR) repeat protein
MANVRKHALEFHIDTPESDDQEQSNEGYFLTPSTTAWLRLHDALDAAEHGSKTYQAYLKKLDRLIDKEPNYLDAYNYAGNAYLEMADSQKADEALTAINAAQRYYSRAFERAKTMIPPEFAGRIIWAHLDNRPFLRAHHGLILCHLRRNEYSQATKMIEEHLAWNPNDNIGVRYLLGDAYLLAGDTVNARRALTVGVSEEYPDSAYSLGLLEFKEGNYSAAATALRIGFIGNMYVAEILTGRTVEKPHFYWHGTSRASVSAAKSYLFEQNMLNLWNATPQAVDFVDWLYNSAAVLRERLELAEIREGLTYENNFTARSIYCDRETLLRKNMTKVTMLIQKVSDRRGENHWPWEHSQSDFID